MGRRVLITGVAGYWGTELARRLERSREFDYIAGLDVRPPGADLERTEFIRADVRNPVIAKLVPQAEVDTIVHSDILLAPEPGKGAKQLHDINVIGSLQLLAACEKSDTIRTIVVRGSSAIYGAEANAPSFFTEEMARRFPLRTRFQRDVGELENYFETFARRFPDVTVTILRFQPSLGPRLDSPLTRYLRAPVVPTQLGYDPLLQFVHADDAVAALQAAIAKPVRGAVNVAGEGSISLSRLLRLAGKVPFPVLPPLFAATVRAGRRLGLAELPPEAVPWLRHGLTLDCTRLIEEVGYRPRSTVATVRDFVEKVGGHRVLPRMPGTPRRGFGTNGQAAPARRGRELKTR
jgi:UDP-glucose 4-epimerase